MITFEYFKFSDDLHKSIGRMGFQSPTLIQEKSIPSILEGRDILGQSATGSGKTLAFGCGVIEKAVPGKGVQALILTPTRELAEQVKNALCELAYNKRVSITAVYGGVAINPQIDALRTADVVVATPGRFRDHLQRGTVDTSKISVFVLDEADRMLDMGFIDDIEHIMKACPKRKQTMFFSATIPYEIEKLSRKYLHEPVKVFAKKQVDPAKLKQIYYDIPKNLKLSLLVHLIKNETAKLIMIFCNKRTTVDLVVRNLRLNKVRAAALHGGFSQNKRTRTVEQFKQGKENILVCTDVAARGMDIENVTHIYNYEMPNDPKEYIHRIGRTARAGEEGKAINLICENDHDNFSRVLMEHPALNVQKVKTPRIERVVFKADRHSNKFGRDRGRFGRDRQRPGYRRRQY